MHGEVESGEGNQVGEVQENKPIFNVTLIEEPLKKVYCLGEELKLVGLRVMAWHSDLTITEIDWTDDRFVATGFDSTEPGKCFVKVYFRDENINLFICDYVVEISNEIYKGGDSKEKKYLQLRTLPTKTTYLLGEEPDFSGMDFWLIDESNNSRTVVTIDNSELSYNAYYDNQSVGLQEISLSVLFEEKQFYFKFPIIYKEKISDKVAVNMIVIDYPTKWEKGATEIDWTNATFQVEYDDGSSEVIEYDEEHFYYTFDVKDNNVVYLNYYESSDYFGEFDLVEITINRASIVEENYLSNKNKNFSLSERELVKQSSIGTFVDIPETYNLKNYLNIKVADQGSEGLCWDFASTKSLETNFYLKYGIGYDLSEKFADYLTSTEFYGDKELGEAGLAEWYFTEMEKTGVPLEETVPYENVDESEYENIENSEKVVMPVSTINFVNEDSIELSSNKKLLRDAMKSHVMKNGSIYCSIVSTAGYNESTNALYHEDGASMSKEGHAISIIGWDDNYSKDNFKAYGENGELFQPSNDGAWIALNSWGDDWGFDEGLFYISYDTQHMSYFGVLDSEPYIEKEQYTYTRNQYKNIVYGNSIDIEGKKFFYIEYDKKEDVEYLTNIIYDISGITKLYVLDNYNEINFSNLEEIGDCISGTFSDINSNVVLDKPLKLEGDKFLIILECDSEYVDCIEYLEVENTHTYYTNYEMSTDWDEYLGDIPLYAYTITQEQYEELKYNEVESVEIIQEPTRKIFFKGEELDFSDGKIKVTYTEGRTETLDMDNENVHTYGYTLYNKSFGSQTITVLYGGKSDTFEITIRDDIKKIEIGTLPNKIVYEYADEILDLTGGTIKIIWSDDSYSELSLFSSLIEVDASEFNTAEEGVQTIKVSYLGCSTEFNIEMKNTITSCKLIKAPNKLDYGIGEAIDLTGGRIRVNYSNSEYEEIDMTDARCKLYCMLVVNDELSVVEQSIEKGFSEIGRYTMFVAFRPTDYGPFDRWWINVKDYKYSVNGTRYETLSEAYDSIEVSGEIIVTANEDVFDASSFKVEEGKNITLDLNGKTIRKTISWITNNGTLTIKDSSESKEGKLSTHYTAPMKVLIENAGILNIEDGEIYNVGIAEDETWFTLINKSNFGEDNSEINISGGKVYAVRSAYLQESIGLPRVIYSRTGKLNVSGGLVKNYVTTPGSFNIISYIEYSGDGEIKVTGGEIINAGGSAIAVTVSQGYANGTTIEVTGGTIIGTDCGILNKGNGAVKIGTNDVTVLKLPKITGDQYGVNSKTGFDFYDGLLKGKEAAYMGNINNEIDGYVLKDGTEGDYKTLYWEENQALRGDVNMDGFVNSTDLQRLYSHLNESNKITNAQQLLIADVNEDGHINSTDLQRLYSHLNGSNLL